MNMSLTDLCRQRGVTILELTQQSGLELQRVQAILMGRWLPSPTERQKIADVLTTPVDQISWGHVTPIQHLYGHGPG